MRSIDQAEQSQASVGYQTTQESRLQVNTRKVGIFLGLSFGLSWTSALVLYLTGINIGTFLGILILSFTFMWAPGVAAIAVQLQSGEPIRDGLGLRLGRLRWVVVAWLTPVALIGATIGIGSILPGVAFTTDFGAYLLDLGLPPDQAEAAVAELEALPVSPAILFVIQGLIAGVTINALAALGEELGWRGLLLNELSPLGFWKFSGITGVIWGIWHAPIILQGHNFPKSPIVGVIVMTVAMISMTPIYTYVTVRAKSVLAATFFHGTFNGLGALTLVYLDDVGNLLIGPVGVAAIGAALLISIICIVHDRIVAETSITTGQPLSPWS